MLPGRHPLLALLTICCLACRPEGPEARVRKAFARAVAAIEKGDAGGAADLLAPNFRGPEDLDRAGARLYLMGLLRRDRIGVAVLANRVEARDREALQSVDLLLTSQGGGLLPQDASRRTYLLRWELRDGE